MASRMIKLYISKCDPCSRESAPHEASKQADGWVQLEITKLNRSNPQYVDHASKDLCIICLTSIKSKLQI